MVNATKPAFVFQMFYGNIISMTACRHHHHHRWVIRKYTEFIRRYRAFKCLRICLSAIFFLNYTQQRGSKWVVLVGDKVRDMEIRSRTVSALYGYYTYFRVVQRLLNEMFVRSITLSTREWNKNRQVVFKTVHMVLLYYIIWNEHNETWQSSGCDKVKTALVYYSTTNDFPHPLDAMHWHTIWYIHIPPILY